MVTLTGRGYVFCARSRSKRRLSQPMFRDLSQWGHPNGSRLRFLRTLSIETKTVSEHMFRDPSRWGHPPGSRLRFTNALDRKEELLLNLCSEILRDGVILLGRACFPYTCSIVTKDRFSSCFQLAPTLRLYSCAPRSGWGTHLLDQVSTWTMVETGYLTSPHTNGLELKACS